MAPKCESAMRCSVPSVQHFTGVSKFSSFVMMTMMMMMMMTMTTTVITMKLMNTKSTYDPRAYHVSVRCCRRSEMQHILPAVLGGCKPSFWRQLVKASPSSAVQTVWLGLAHQTAAFSLCAEQIQQLATRCL